MCRNWKFWAVLAALAAGAVAVTPITLSALVPLLVFAACPLMMIVGGGVIARGARGARRVPRPAYRALPSGRPCGSARETPSLVTPPPGRPYDAAS